MSVTDFESNALWLNLALLVVAAVAVWLAGARLARVADEIARRRELGRAFAGLLLLGTVTSLPEITTTATGSIMGDAALVTSNLYGGVAAQTCIIAFADLIALRKPLTRRVRKSVLILQASFLVLLLVTAAAASVLGERASTLGVGLGTAVVFGLFLLCLRVSQRYERDEAWRPKDAREQEEGPEEEVGKAKEYGETKLYLVFTALAAVIVAAGWLLTRTADALAKQTGTGSSLVGATLIAVTTALPEISTTFSAVKIGAYTMAVSNIFGGNLFDAALVFPADLLYRRGPILAELPRETLFLMLVAGMMTLVYVWGLIERRKKAVLGMGLDSVLVLACYALGIAGLFLLQKQ